MSSRWLARGSWVLLCFGVAAACGAGDEKKSVAGREGGAGQGGGAAEGGLDGGAGESSDGGQAASAAVGGRGHDGGAASGNAAMGDAGAGGNGGDAGGASGSAGGAGGEPPVDGLYVSVTGSDSASGTLDEPFLTLAHAASVAQAGDTIVLMDGDHVLLGTPGASISLLDGVDLVALNDGRATLAAQGAETSLELGGEHVLRGLAFRGFHNALHFAPSAGPGQLSISRSTFQGCVDTCIEVSGAATVDIHAEQGAPLGDGTGKFVLASGSSQVRVDGGVLRNFVSNTFSFDAAIEARGDSVVEVTNLLVDDGIALAFSARETATLNAKNVIVTSLGRHVVWLANSAAVTFIDSDLSLKAGAAVKGACIEQTMNGTGSIWLERSKLHSCESGLYGATPGVLHLIDSELYDLTLYGMDGDGVGGSVTITRSKFYAFGQIGLRLGPSTANIELSIRDSELTAPTVALTAGPAGLQLAASPASALDLGTAADPGGNLIKGHPTAIPGVRFHSSQGGLLTAVGNTWVAGEQGADGAGHYGGSQLDVSGPVPAGANYGVSFAGAVLRLAE